VNRRLLLYGLVSLVVAPGFGRAASAEKKTLIIAIGDSTTAGSPFFKSPLEAPPDGEGDPEGQYAYWMMKKRPNWVVLNYGVAGETTSQIRARFEEAMKRVPRYVIILGGVNDVYQGIPVKLIEDNLLWMYKEAQGQALMPVAATVLPFDAATPEQAQAIDALNHWIKSAAEKMRMPIADTNASLRDPNNPHKLNGSPDGLHPDVGGYRKMGMDLIDAIDPIEKAWR
jgi:lysophospholipase L1-like esterase